MNSVGGKRFLPPRVKAAWDPARHQRTADLVWRAIEAKRRRRRLAGPILLAGLPAISALVLWAVVGGPRDANDRAEKIPPIVSAQHEGRVEFHKGAIATLLTPATKLRLEQGDVHNAHAVLDDGQARLDVVQALPGSAFTLEVQGVFVEVMSSRFVVQRQGARAHVLCESGTAHVHWPGGEATLQAGMSGTFPPSMPATATLGIADGRAAVRKAAGRAPKSPPPKVQVPVPEAAEIDVDSLIERANVARRQGNPRHAVALLDEAMAADATRGLAAAAALTKGRVLLSELGDAEAACKAFSWLRTHVPQSPLAEDALAWEAVALSQRGLTEQAAALSQLYLERYPNGAHAPRVRALRTPP